MAKRDYGGAYDIDPYSFFTKEDIVEFGMDVADAVSEQLDRKLELADTYIADTESALIIELSDADGWNVATELRLDMRKIRKPSDIQKYKDIAVTRLANTYQDDVMQYEDADEDEIDECTEVTGAVYADPYDTDEVEVTDSIAIDITGVMIIGEDGKWNMTEDWTDTGETYYEGKFFDVYLDKETLANVVYPDELYDLLYDNFPVNKIPTDPGRYPFSCTLHIDYEISSIWKNPYYDLAPKVDWETSGTVYDTDNAECYIRDITIDNIHIG